MNAPNPEIFQAMLTCGAKAASAEMKTRLRDNWILSHIHNPVKMLEENPTIPAAAVAYWLASDAEFLAIFLSSESGRQFMRAIGEARSAFLAACKPTEPAKRLVVCFQNARTADIFMDTLAGVDFATPGTVAEETDEEGEQEEENEDGGEER